MILSFGLLLVNKGSEDTYENVGKPSCMLLFLYSFVGGCFLTFKEPFEQVRLAIEVCACYMLVINSHMHSPGLAPNIIN